MKVNKIIQIKNIMCHQNKRGKSSASNQVKNKISKMSEPRLFIFEKGASPPLKLSPRFRLTNTKIGVKDKIARTGGLHPPEPPVQLCIKCTVKIILTKKKVKYII